ncbi:dTDP-4-dehydrorhamnose reductase [Candidatus Methylopumilus universalis]|uniref:dTDP-4-dehydrorhamnose reductase n=1 Tax=Candidatus Methylopumilus universalis TaxID=2588536 RepID=UPI001122370C|nr:dTDP-4-dehydrorhamnose reductase [Candidatus Methylopumilus universalis]QDC70780.1 dTDP-4-dehydrorhamnose reductase [Candidatus Methylopumilus universalis]
MQDILILGKTGQIGNSLLEVFSSNSNLHAFDSKGANLTNEPQLRYLIKKIKPRLIINAAAFTAVDQAEIKEIEALKVNARGIEIIGEEAEVLGAAVIHFSSEYVFDGTKKNPYLETDRTNPLSSYGTSKLKGEKLLLKACSRSVIIRTSWVASHHGNNFLKTILKLAHEKNILRVVSDQLGVPTSSRLIAEISKALSERLEHDPEHFPFGIYHLVPSGETSWFDYANFVIKEAIIRGDTLKLGLDSIQAIRTEDYPLPARRPKNSRLDTHLIQNTFGITLPSWQDGILDIMDKLYKG